MELFIDTGLQEFLAHNAFCDGERREEMTYTHLFLNWEDVNSVTGEFGSYLYTNWDPNNSRVKSTSRFISDRKIE